MGPRRLERRTYRVKEALETVVFLVVSITYGHARSSTGSNHGSKTATPRYPTTGLWTLDPANVSLRNHSVGSMDTMEA